MTHNPVPLFPAAGRLLLVRLVLGSVFALGACSISGPGPGSGRVTWVPDGDGRVTALHHQRVLLPGLEYLTLGARQPDTIEALRAHGFDCSEEASVTQACVRPPGAAEPTGGVVMLEFQHLMLSGVQAQLQPPGERSELAQQQFESLEAQWTKSYGKGEMVKRPGIVATRHNLRNGTVLLAVSYEGEPTLIVEHLQMQVDKIRIPPPPRESGTR